MRSQALAQRTQTHLARIQQLAPLDHVFFLGVVADRGQDHPRHRPARASVAGRCVSARAAHGARAHDPHARSRARARAHGARTRSHRWSSARTKSASAAATTTCRSVTCCRCAAAAARPASTTAGTGISSVTLRQAPLPAACVGSFPMSSAAGGFLHPRTHSHEPH